MAMRIMLDAQHTPYKQQISGWHYRNKPPYVTQEFAHCDPAKNYLFKCRECGTSEFSCRGESIVECDSCCTEYVVVWTES